MDGRAILKGTKRFTPLITMLLANLKQMLMHNLGIRFPNIMFDTKQVIMKNYLLSALVILFGTTGIVQAQDFEAELNPKRSSKGKSVDLTINTKAPLTEDATQGNLINFEVFLEKSDDSEKINLKNIERQGPETKTATISLSNDIATGPYDFIVRATYKGFGERALLVKEYGAFTVISFVENYVTLTPDKAGKGEAVNIEIVGEKFSFNDSRPDIFLTKGPRSNVNTTELKGLVVQNPSLITGTIEIFNSISTGKYDLVYENNDEVIFRQKNAFEVLRYPVGLPNKNKKTVSLTKAYPNPLQNSFTVEMDLPQPMMLKGTVLDASGKTLKKAFERDFDAGKQEISEINLGKEFSKGVYFLRISADEKDFTKVIKLNKQ